MQELVPVLSVALHELVRQATNNDGRTGVFRIGPEENCRSLAVLFGLLNTCTWDMWEAMR